MRTVLFLFALLLASSAFAQPERYGCHYYRNLHSFQSPKKLTQAQLKDLEGSIARSDTFNIVHYDLALDVTDYNGNYLIAEANILLEALEPDRESIVLDLLDLEVDSVTSSGVSLNYSHDGNLLQVYFDETPAVNEQFTLTVYYQGIPHQDPQWGGFYFESDYIYNLGIGLTTIPPNFGKVWYPCFDTFVERASYTYHVKSAGGKVAFCQGELTEDIALEGDTVLRTFNFEHQIPTHLSAIAVADYETDWSVHSGVFGDYDVSLTAKPNNLSGMVNVFQDLAYSIDALEYWWGPYVWGRIGYVLTTDGALEIPNNIAYPQFMVNESLTSNGRLFSHELGHHWWGNHTTMRTHNDMWMKEGPAEYSAHLFTEWKDGPEAFIEQVKDNHLFVLEEAHVQDEGFWALSPMPDEHIYGRHTYYKGASVMHNLRAYLGDELFREGMQAVLQAFPYQTLDAYQFQETLTEETGVDVAPFFDGWIFQPGFSSFEIDTLTTVSVGEQFETTLHLEQKLRAANDFHEEVPLEVSFWDANWERTDEMIMTGGDFDTHTLTTDFLPVMVALNANGKLNQARMDHTYVIDGTSGFQQVDFCDVRIGCNAINEGDSALVHVEHQWVAPDTAPAEDYIAQFSATHYWQIDGIWPEDIELDGRFTYRGSDPEDLDYDLVGFSESGILLIWRPDASTPWELVPEWELQAGNLFNGTGTVTVPVLQKGQYAFANGDAAASIQGLAQAEDFYAYPNPCTDRLVVQLPVTSSDHQLELVDMTGKIVWNMRSGNGQQSTELDVTGFAAGKYLLRITDGTGASVAPARSIEIL